MQEKEMISDYLAGLNASLAAYGGIISQCENQQLRETIQQMRNQDEYRQYNLLLKLRRRDIIYQHNQQLQKKLQLLNNKCLKDSNSDILVNLIL